MWSSTHPNWTLHALHAAQMALATILVIVSGVYVHRALALRHMTKELNLASQPFYCHYVAGLLVGASNSSEALASLKL